MCVSLSISICAYVCVHVCADVCVHVCACVCACACVRMWKGECSAYNEPSLNKTIMTSYQLVNITTML